MSDVLLLIWADNGLGGEVLCERTCKLPSLPCIGQVISIDSSLKASGVLTEDNNDMWLDDVAFLVYASSFHCTEDGVFLKGKCYVKAVGYDFDDELRAGCGLSEIEEIGLTKEQLAAAGWHVGF
jgi:hypothetical protein